ncbi:hypothetical protein DEV91_15815 [Phyllobacterium brassicacearum]|nr:hypothetical protein DEV91_15815 [Phyllobacterium brassicacearum]
MSCSANVYFRERRELDAIRAEYAKAAASRPTQWFRLWTGVPTHETERFEHYRPATEADLAAGLPRVVSISPVLPVPSRWVSVFSYRLKVYSWTNGSAGGGVRAAHIPSGAGGFYKEEVGRVARKVDENMKVRKRKPEAGRIDPGGVLLSKKSQIREKPGSSRSGSDNA